MPVSPTFYLLGPPRIAGDRPASISSKHAAILAIAAFQHPRPVRRSYLSQLLWPTASSQNARHSLSQAIYNIRRRVGEQLLDVRPASIGVGDSSCDLLDYRRLMSQGAFDAAASFLAGEFCEGLDVEGCVEFHHWLDTARQALRRESQQLAEEPLEPDLQKQVAEFLKLGSIEPTTFSPRTGTRGHKAFVGRVEERRQLEDAWRASLIGEVTTALVTGDAGIGKTTLCQRTVKKTVLKGSTALLASGYEVQRNLPYGVVSQLFNDAATSRLLKNLPSKWLDVLGVLAPVVEQGAAPPSPSPEADQHMFAGAIHQAFREITNSQPATVFVDDVQWADAASMAVLHYIAHCALDLPIFFLFASRRLGGDFFGAGKWSVTTSVDLNGLTLDEAKALLGSTGASNGEGDWAALHHMTRGNPLLLNALSTKIAAPSTRLPPSARQYYRRELGRMSDEAQLLGAALAAAGKALGTSELGWIVEYHEDTVTRALNSLLEGGFVEADPEGSGGFRLTHDIVGDAFLENLSAVDSAKLHGRVAKFLRDSGSPIAIVATQLMVAGSDAETCQYAMEAAMASLRLYAYREAEHFYRIAIAVASSAAVDVEARVALSSILLRQGRTEEARKILGPNGNEENLSSRQAALLEAHRLIARLAEAAPPSVPKAAFSKAKELESVLEPRVASRLYVDIATNAQQDLRELVEEATEAALRLIASMEAGPARIGLEVQVASLQAMNATKVNLDWINRLTRESARWPDSLAACHSAAGVVQVSRGDVADAETRFTRALEICEQYGFFDQRLRVLNNLGVCYLEQGNWILAERQFRTVMNAGGAVAPKELSSAAANVLTLAYERGQFERTIELGGEYLANTLIQARLRFACLAVLGLAHLELGQLSKARAIANTIQIDSPVDGPWSNDISYFEIFLARMAVIDGDAQRAERRLRAQVAAFANRDFYCSARMDVERIRLSVVHSPKAALGEALQLRESLAKGRAAPLVERLDHLVEKCRSRLN